MALKGRILIYSIIGCPHCMRAKNTLQELGLPFVDINLDSYPQCREPMKHRIGRTSVPQVFFNSIHVGGNEDLQKLVNNKKDFEALVAEVTNIAPPADAPYPPDPETAVNNGGLTDIVCEPDEYARLVMDLKGSGIIKDQGGGFLSRSQKSCFKGKDFVSWVTKTKHLGHPEALEMGQMLIDQHFGHRVGSSSVAVFKDDDTMYRLIEDDESSALNAGETSECAMMPVNELGEAIRRLILQIYSVFLSADGRSVNYKSIATSSEFKKYGKLTRELVRVDIEKASRDEKVAFFINIYNALVIHANIVRGPPSNLWQRYKFFNTVQYIIGGQTYSLQDIENGVLRANRKGVGMLFKPFGKNDPRLKISLETPEPLIHFALVCGAKSCPPIKTFSAHGLQQQLQMAAEAFLESDNGCQLVSSKNEVRLSMIFKWYQEDFGSSHIQVIQFVHNHMSNGAKKETLGSMLQTNKAHITFMPYDWSINSK
ncbi:hypothetical protein CAPTEDRAFT_203097 [Capitella teleta]|uniref:Uncharacterized protein n=1 Tax=Capitella teleta TaxID=283909 RepID=R7UWK1_CAPTE|nr:hypothetical protein CAPTEDRAFT_203097 [Capitella teleta]|eukprot:ELU10998.1 hypothetical protein CAPTEDRAFT_203097 [Capitella teleta]